MGAVVIVPSFGEGGCACDPAIYTTDCNQTHCTPFMATFLFFQLSLLIFYIFIITHVELKSKKKSLLWRIILPSAAIACLSKCIRLGILANPTTRFSAGEVALMFLYNTHLCMASIAYITLLFFWMRLKHDLVANQRIFGKLKPAYIATITVTVVFYYAQVLAKGVLLDSKFIMYILMYTNGVVCFSLAVLFIVYTVAIWGPYLSQQNTTTLFYKTFIGATITSGLIIAFCVELVVSNTTGFYATPQYYVKHSIYETLFLLQLICIPSGFVVHYFQYHFTNIKPRSIDLGFHKSTSDPEFNTFPSSLSSFAFSSSSSSSPITSSISPPPSPPPSSSTPIPLSSTSITVSEDTESSTSD